MLDLEPNPPKPLKYMYLLRDFRVGYQCKQIRFMNNGPNYTRIAKKAKTYSMDSNFVKQGVDKKERKRKQEDREESRTFSP